MPDWTASLAALTDAERGAGHGAVAAQRECAVINGHGAGIGVDTC